MNNLLYFLPLCFVIAIVLSAVKRDEPRAIFLQGGKLFGFLVLGTLGFSALLQLTSRSAGLLFGMLSIIGAVLVYFTLKGVWDWIRGVEPDKASSDTQAHGAGQE